MMKRIIDVIVSGVLLVIMAPLMLVIAGAIRLKLGAPILFRQQRPGLHGKPFTLLKFRSMSEARDSQGNLRPDADRLKPFGRFLRSTSLDELPELLNVLKGEMSLVGPRPLLMQYLELYTPEQMRRHDVRPGITGWAQVKGRNALSWEQKFALDLWYVDNHTLWLDSKIILLTLWQVFRRRGISQPGHATTKPFMGNRS